MIFKVFDNRGLRQLLTTLIDSYNVVGPVEIAQGRDGSMLGFRPVNKFEDLRLGGPVTRHSAKEFFLPHTEVLARFSSEKSDWHKQAALDIDTPLVLMGLHPCDINALNKLDKVLLSSDYPMPHYATRRANTFIVGHDCMPQPECFCRSMGTDTVHGGFDMFLTNLGDDKYMAEVLSNTAYNMLMQIECSDPTDEDHELFKDSTSSRNSAFKTSIDTTDLTKLLDMEFQSGVWEHWGEKCFSCGSCASVCPTCYCHGTDESLDLNLKDATKTRVLHSCNLVDFALVAGGHNFRKEPHVRLKYRYYHKHRGFVEAYEEPLCVGCGRCGLSCLGGITVPKVIESVRSEEIV